MYFYDQPWSGLDDWQKSEVAVVAGGNGTPYYVVEAIDWGFNRYSYNNTLYTNGPQGLLNHGPSVYLDQLRELSL